MAIQFTASGDALANNVTNGVDLLTVAATSPLSITCWIKAPWTGTGTNSLVGLYDETQRIASGTANTSTAVQLGKKTTNTFNVWTWGGGVLVDCTISMAPYNNVWCFLTYTFDGTTHRAYVNGVAGGTATSTQLAGAFDRVYLNGYTNGGAAETATFQLDTYTSYSRALSANEIQTMFMAQGDRHGIVNGAIVRYEFDEGALGTTVSTIVNLTDFASANSNLITVVPAGGTRVTFVEGYPDGNLRPPQC
jgi:hypothetical protein